MSNEDIKLNENSNYESGDLPIPEAEAPITDIADPDYIPAPEDSDEYLPDITPEIVREEMMGVDEEGYTRCVVMVELKKIEKFNPSEAEGKALESLMGAREEEAEDGYEEEPFQYTPITDFEVMYCKVREYTLDGSIVNLELIFDSPYDKEMEAVHKLLEEYKEMGEAFDKAEPGEGDYPIFTIYFMPYRYPMQATASYTQPFAYFKALSYDQDDERVLHLLFPIERTEIACYHVKKSELEAMKEHAASIQREGGYI